MVYQGKPSRGCQMCRTRRIKCDETKPTCNQCAKSRRTCPGYKDEFDLVFRNETEATERRAQRASRKAIVQRRTKVSIPNSTSSASSMLFLSSNDSSDTYVISPVPQCGSKNYTIPRTSTNTITEQPQMNLEQQATCHFLSNYVLIPQQGKTRGFLDYVIPLLKLNTVAPHFKAAFDACAMTSLANHFYPAPALAEIAGAKYSMALSTLKNVLRQEDAEKSDYTLATALLLGLFENLTTRKIGLLAWGPHIEGAIQLVKRRGRKQLRTKVGLSLFIAVRTQMIIHTLSTAKPPGMQLEWWVNSDTTRDRYASQCQKFNIHTGAIRTEVNRLMSQLPRTEESIASMRHIIKQAQEVDQECVGWAKSLPDSFQCRTVTWEDNVPNGIYSQAEVFPGRVDAYQDLWVASVWNMMRCSRIILASIVVRCAAWVCSPVDYRTTPEYAAATRICVETITDIIASVPYQLGWFNERKHLLQQARVSGFACGDDNFPKSLSGYFLTWPLACAYGQDYTTDNQRAWIKGRLTHIGKHMGVGYALILCEINARTPSMLIRRDGLMATSALSNFETMLSKDLTVTSNTSSVDLVKVQETAKRKEVIERQTAELVNKVMGDSGVVDEFTAKSWLQMQPSFVMPFSESEPLLGSDDAEKTV